MVVVVVVVDGLLLPSHMSNEMRHDDSVAAQDPTSLVACGCTTTKAEREACPQDHRQFG